MAQEHKFTRPENPFTPKVMENIKIKVNTLLKKYKDFQNAERHEYRRNDIASRLAGAVMKAWHKFEENDRCSFESFADRFIKFEVSHYKRDNIRIIEEERATSSGDRPVRNSHANGDDDGGDDAPTMLDCMADMHDDAEAGFDEIDFRAVVEILEEMDPTYARIYSLRRDGYKRAEIALIIGVPQWKLDDILWPMVQVTVKRIYDDRV